MKHDARGGAGRGLSPATVCAAGRGKRASSSPCPGALVKSGLPPTSRASILTTQRCASKGDSGAINSLRAKQPPYRHRRFCTLRGHTQHATRNKHRKTQNYLKRHLRVAHKRDCLRVSRRAPKGACHMVLHHSQAPDRPGRATPSESPYPTQASPYSLLDLSTRVSNTFSPYSVPRPGGLALRESVQSTAVLLGVPNCVPLARPTSLSSIFSLST